MLLLSFRTGKFLVVGGCPVHCKMFCSIPGLHPLDASSSPELWQPKMSLATDPHILGCWEPKERWNTKEGHHAVKKRGKRHCDFMSLLAGTWDPDIWSDIILDAPVKVFFRWDVLYGCSLCPFLFFFFPFPLFLTVWYILKETMKTLWMPPKWPSDVIFTIFVLCLFPYKSL